MAKPIKPTPTLIGRNADNFYRNMERNRIASNPSEKERILEALKSISVDKSKSKN